MISIIVNLLIGFSLPNALKLLSMFQVGSYKKEQKWLYELMKECLNEEEMKPPTMIDDCNTEDIVEEHFR